MPSANNKLPFAKGDHVVYPTHGVGKVLGIEKQVIAGFELKVYVISFEADKMILRVPVEKAKDYIAAGDIFQVNLARRETFSVRE